MNFTTSNGAEIIERAEVVNPVKSTLGVLNLDMDDFSLDEKPAKKRNRRTKKPKDMPSRPLSAYNIFFSYERKKILKEMKRQAKEVPSVATSQQPISFVEMAKMVGTRWQSMSEEEMEPYKKLAKKDMDRYLRERDDYQFGKKSLTNVPDHRDGQIVTAQAVSNSQEGSATPGSQHAVMSESISFGSVTAAPSSMGHQSQYLEGRLRVHEETFLGSLATCDGSFSPGARRGSAANGKISTDRLNMLLLEGARRPTPDRKHFPSLLTPSSSMPILATKAAQVGRLPPFLISTPRDLTQQRSTEEPNLSASYFSSLNGPGKTRSVGEQLKLALTHGESQFVGNLDVLEGKSRANMATIYDLIQKQRNEVASNISETHHGFPRSQKSPISTWLADSSQRYAAVVGNDLGRIDSVRPEGSLPVTIMPNNQKNTLVQALLNQSQEGKGRPTAVDNSDALLGCQTSAYSVISSSEARFLDAVAGLSRNAVGNQVDILEALLERERNRTNAARMALIQQLLQRQEDHSSSHNSSYY